ncbi:putative WD repeat-containing protein C2A9.03 [Pseudocercospora fuligena]|uniref:Putative WD repeat-containing protein C2A9.03 n=1 Tax=Pseudocercospora fuligena TaxID=685502 RepID=A0A8H6RY92_9PEZI|nr:putative WD repeat-containing protein C2A9.03 [Pseudocercospora fuligena]
MAIDAQSHELDEDALAVDDPRRSYDVADFMDTWRLHSICNKRLPPFEPGLQPSLRLGRRPDHITRGNVNNLSVDMQGIRWQLIGPSRSQATIARAMLHPSGLGADCLRSKQQTKHNAFVRDHERHHQFRATISQHKAKFSHYQLRNVLTANNRNDVFYATGDHVTRASMACPTMIETTMDLSKPGNSATSFRVTCLSASSKQAFSEYRTDDVLLAGGFCGEYAVLNLDADQRHSEGFVTHAYNGLVTHIHSYRDRRSGNLRAAFCSNDRKVRLMDVSTLKFTDEFSYDNAINCSATAPDGRLRVLAGDTSDTLITDAERGAPIVTLKEHKDHGFACAWSTDGRHVATGAQDGSVLVWDSRKWSKPLRSLDTVMSCARSLNFTDTGELVVAENDDVVRVYDAGRFDAWQELRFFGSIAGVALLDGGAELVIANADKTVGGLMTFERSSRGVGSGSYGRKVAKAGPNGAKSRRGKSLREAEYVGELLI